MLPAIFGQILMIVFSVILCIFALMLMSAFGIGVYFVVRTLKERKLSASPFNPYTQEAWQQVEELREDMRNMSRFTPDDISDIEDEDEEDRE